MIGPTKYLGLESCVLRVSATILEYMLASEVESTQALAERLEVELGQDARLNMVPALSLLFLLGCIDYVESIDAFQLTLERNAA